MERENRKVLISVKVSTLLLILIAIIVGIVLINKIKVYIKNNNNAELANNTEYEQIDVIEEQKNRVIKADVSSRATNAEEKRHSELEEEKSITEEIVLDNNQDTTETPKILYGAVGSINFDDAAIENSIEEEMVPEEVQTTPIEEVTISKDMDLTIRTGLSREDFITLMSGVKEDKSNFFEENAGLIYDICEEYQINEIFFCGLIAGESGWRIADNHRRTHNYISLMSGGKLIRFSSVEDGLRKAAEALHNNYLTEGGRFYYGKTLAAVKTRFCPASTTWVNLIYGNMKTILY